jgi:hypothetical protein
MGCGVVTRVEIRAVPASPQLTVADDLLPANEGTTRPSEPTPPARHPRQIGVAGASALNKYERHQARDAERLQRRFGRLTPIAKHFVDEPQSTAAWKKGAAGEVRLAAMLDQRADKETILLHDFHKPGTKSNIDHIAIAPSGIWIIDAKRYTGKVSCRTELFSPQRHLIVNSRDRTRLVGGMQWQIETVTTALDGFAAETIRPVVCFTNSEWHAFARPFQIDRVEITWPQRLCKTINAPGCCRTRTSKRPPTS